MFAIVDKDKLKVLYRWSGYRQSFGFAFSDAGHYTALSGLIAYSLSADPGLHPGLFLMALQAFLKNAFSMLSKA